MKLSQFDNAGYDRGASKLKEALWLVVSGIFFESWIPGSNWRVIILRIFGSKIGSGVIIKPHCRIKFPWNLRVGDHTWIGEGSWFDNLAPIDIGSNVCISQGTYLCTGSHDWTSIGFDLLAVPIEIADHAWIAAFAVVAPGTLVQEGAVVGMRQLVSGEIPAWTILQAKGQSPRKISENKRPNS
jgi:putative colanic acid biosynthesis acetyltransferase WcaF